MPLVCPCRKIVLGLAALSRLQIVRYLPMAYAGTPCADALHLADTRLELREFAALVCGSSAHVRILAITRESSPNYDRPRCSKRLQLHTLTGSDTGMHAS